MILQSLYSHGRRVCAAIDETAMSIYRFKCFAADETGATAIEYGLIAALVSVAIAGASMFLGGGISNTFNYVATQITAAGN